MFVSGCAVLSGKALISRKKPSQDQRETQPGVTQTRGVRRKGRYEVREERGTQTRKRERGRENQPGVAQTVKEEKEVTEVVIESAITLHSQLISRNV